MSFQYVRCHQILLISEANSLLIVTNISFTWSTLLDTLQLATRATGLLSQGATAVNHGYSVHALGPILGEYTQAIGGVAFGVH